MRWSALVFDLDGTLIDTAPDIKVALNKLLAEHRRPALSLQQVTAMIGDGVAKLVTRAFAADGEVPSGDCPAPLTQKFLAYYEGHAADLSAPYPAVASTLARLRADGLRLGVCTNKPQQPTLEILRRFKLDGYFDAVCGGDRLGGIRKPDPRPILAVLGEMAAGADEAVMVGDNANDVAAARAAGLPVILRAGGYTEAPAEELGGDLVIRRFEELPEALARLAGGARACLP
jgi:phosphoglycolate phosphatase